MKIFIDVCACDDYQFNNDAVKKHLEVDLNIDNIQDSAIDVGALTARLVIDAAEEHFANDQKQAETELEKLN